MKILPTGQMVLIRMHDVPTDSKIELPEGLTREPYGEVIAIGPACLNAKVGDKVIYTPNSFLLGFDKGGDERFLLPESAIIANCVPNELQDGQPNA